MLARINAVFTLIQLLITVFLTIIFMYIFRANHRKVRKIWAKCQLFLLGIKLHFQGSPNPQTKLLLINHQSMVDIIIFEAIHSGDPCWVAKEEITNLPLFGRIMDVPKMISINRNDKRSLVKMLKEAKERVSEGRVIAMFPEGTRTNGDRLLKFQLGAKTLAEKLDLLVQPIVLINTKFILNEKTFTAHRGDVKVIYLDAIDPKSDENWYENLHTQMEKVLQDELANASSHR